VPDFVPTPVKNTQQLVAATLGRATACTRLTGPDNSTWLTALMAQNSLESVEEGMVHSERNIYTEYADPRRTEWIVKIQPALKKAKLEVLVEACGKWLCRREIIELRAGRKKPHRRTQQLLESILKRLGFL